MCSEQYDCWDIIGCHRRGSSRITGNCMRWRRSTAEQDRTKRSVFHLCSSYPQGGHQAWRCCLHRRDQYRKDKSHVNDLGPLHDWDVSYTSTSDTFPTAVCNGILLQVEFAIAFIGVTLARAVAAPAELQLPGGWSTAVSAESCNPIIEHSFAIRGGMAGCQSIVHVWESMGVAWRSHAG